MAGMEELEIHSKSYLVRWVNVQPETTISWSIQPHKKSIHFGIFKHPGSGAVSTPKPASSTFVPPPTPALSPDNSNEDCTLRNASSVATEKLKKIGLIPISWYGTYEANKISTGKLDVPPDGGGMYALVFDNTFSKTLAKTATFVLSTYPTNAPPRPSHHVLAPTANGPGFKSKASPRMGPVRHESSDSLNRIGSFTSEISTNASINQSAQGDGAVCADPNLFTGVLRKRRRKRHQGYARRFFSLDFMCSTLSYYHNRNTLALRGSVPLSLAAVGANAKTLEISIDSGAEVWHLKANNQREFKAWKEALEQAASSSYNSHTPTAGRANDPPPRTQSAFQFNAEEEREWALIEALVGRVAGSRDAVRRLAQDADPAYSNDNGVDTNLPLSPSGDQSPSEGAMKLTFLRESDSRPFWKRKPSSSERKPLGLPQRSASATSAKSPPLKISPARERGSFFSKGQSFPTQNVEETFHDHCMAVLRDLNSVMADFSELIIESKKRRAHPSKVVSSGPRNSLESSRSEEFFDAAEDASSSQLLRIHSESDIEGEQDMQLAVDAGDDSASASDVEHPKSLSRKATSEAITSSFPSKAKSLSPLPFPSIKRRSTISPPLINPPSLVSFVRKNVGKDFSQISMPVSANEPTSLLQRVAEQMEYSELLDDAVSIDAGSGERILFISAFAISSFSNSRAKERAVRKPFNPMLGETYELVREDKGFRFIAEKVSHHPVRLASQAESELWSLTQAPAPTQKFWGKSAELNTDGKVRVVLHPTGDCYSWAAPTCFLRNMLAGEKYVEPVGTMTITNDNSGESAVVTFKSKGMFAGRSEDVEVKAYDTDGEELPTGLTGKWTSFLSLTEHGTIKGSPIWHVGELVANAPKVYGFTTFAASLNEVTPAEEGKLPPTDSRLRPDQRVVEKGDFDAAEPIKVRLEEAQRKRRKAMEERGELWKPRWFAKIEGLTDASGEEIWCLKHGKEGYWEEREKGDWRGVEPIFEG